MRVFAIVKKNIAFRIASCPAARKDRAALEHTPPGPRKTSMRRLALVLCLAFGCGSSAGPNLPDGEGLASQVKIDGDDAPAAAVRVDSVAWRPRRLLPLSFDSLDPELEIEGTYAVFFRNAGDAPLDLRYDLHFLDRDGFLIDVFNPFGLPLRLEPGAALRHGDLFSIRAATQDQVEDLATLQVNVRVAAGAAP